MDPLGARPTTITPKEVTRWSSEEPTSDPLSKASMAVDVLGAELPNAHKTPPFSIRPDLNQKVAFMVGDITKLSVEAIVNPTNESLTDKNPVSNKLLEIAGQELRDELKTQVISCRTGDAKITTAYALPARHVIHTVGPRYNVKYRTAAESALYNCYRSVLQMVKNRSITTVAIPTLVSYRRNYPPVEGAHVALRAVRRFLEHFGECIDLLVFVGEENDPYIVNSSLQPIYHQLFSLYFPRTEEEEDFSRRALPLDLGNEFGEPVIEERQIRISDQPLSKMRGMGSFDNSEELDESDEERKEDLISPEVGQHPFSMMSKDLDLERKEVLAKHKAAMSEEEERARRYQQFLRMSRTENFTEIINLGAFFRAGQDYQGRQVMVYVGKLFPATKFDLNKAVAYFISLMEPIVRREFVLVYFHTEVDSEEVPDNSFFKDLYSLLDERYKNNLKTLYIVHPNMWFKMSSWWFLTWTASEIKEKVIYLTGVEYLYDTISSKQINVPSFVMEYDRKTNGSNYYKPVLRAAQEPQGGGEL